MTQKKKERKEALEIHVEIQRKEEKRGKKERKLKVFFSLSITNVIE